MGEAENKESQSEGSVATPQLSHHLFKEKEPETAESSSGVRHESNVDPLPKDQPTSPLHQIPAARTDTKDSVNRDAVLARVESEKRFALVKAWEENEKTKAENRAYKMLSAVELWENKKKASTEARHKIIEEKLERKKADYVEIKQNKLAEIHRLAEEKRAMIEAQKGEELLKVEETAAKFRTRGYVPRKFFPCFGG